MPPSQKCSPSISMAGKPGGRAPDAIMCSGPIFLPRFLNSKLSKYLKLPVVTLTAPTLRRHFRSLIRSKSGSKETGHTEGSDQCRAGLVEQRAPAVTLGDGIPRHRRRNHLPEFL